MIISGVLMNSSLFAAFSVVVFSLVAIKKATFPFVVVGLIMGLYSILSSILNLSGITTEVLARTIYFSATLTVFLALVSMPITGGKLLIYLSATRSLSTLLLTLVTGEILLLNIFSDQLGLNKSLGVGGYIRPDFLFSEPSVLSLYLVALYIIEKSADIKITRSKELLFICVIGLTASWSGWLLLTIFFLLNNTVKIRLVSLAGLSAAILAIGLVLPEMIADQAEKINRLVAHSLGVAQHHNSSISIRFESFIILRDLFSDETNAIGFGWGFGQLSQVVSDHFYDSPVKSLADGQLVNGVSILIISVGLTGLATIILILFCSWRGPGFGSYVILLGVVLMLYGNMISPFFYSIAIMWKWVMSGRGNLKNG